VSTFMASNAPMPIVDMPTNSAIIIRLFMIYPVLRPIAYIFSLTYRGGGESREI
jgi:hypothetical protein